MIGHLLTQRATISRKTAANDSYESKASFTVAATNVPCLVQGKNGSIRALAAGRNDVALYRAFFEAGADIRTQDRLALDGVTYVVTFVQTHARPAHIEADLALSNL